jgi:hypothetical protein
MTCGRVIAGGAAAIHAMSSATCSGGSASSAGRAVGGRPGWSRWFAVQVPQEVSIAPGYRTQTRMLCGLPSAARAWVNPVRPNLAEQGV